MDKQNKILLLLFTSAINVAFCQDSSNKVAQEKSLHFGFTVAYTNASTESYDRHYIEPVESIDPSFEVRIGRHSISAGAKIFLYQESSGYFDEQSERGIRLSYKFLFKKPDNRFNHFGFIDITYARFKYVIIVSPAQSWYPYTRQSTRVYYNLNFEGGYGIQYKIIKEFFLSASLGAGIHLFDRNYFLEVPENPKDNYNEYGHDLFGYGQLSGFMRMGVGYEF